MAAGAQNGFKARLTSLGLRELTLIPAIIVVGFVGWLNNPAFLTSDNLLNILQQSSELSILVIAPVALVAAGAVVFMVGKMRRL